MTDIAGDSFLGIHGAALALREQRLQLLSANIANADTPGYRAQDLDFNRALRAALQPGPAAGGDAVGDAAAARPPSRAWTAIPSTATARTRPSPRLPWSTGPRCRSSNPRSAPC